MLNVQTDHLYCGLDEAAVEDAAVEQFVLLLVVDRFHEQSPGRHYE